MPIELNDEFTARFSLLIVRMLAPAVPQVNDRPGEHAI
jgi:hypothetical protein